MAITIGNTFQDTDISSIPAFDSGTGSNRVLVAAIVMAFAADNAIIGLSYGGNAMTALAAQQNDTNGWSGVRVFYLVNPPTGSNSFVATTEDNEVANMVAMVLDGVDTAAPIGTPNSAGGEGTTASVTLAQTATGNLLIAGVSNGTDSATITGTGGSTVEEIDAGGWWVRGALVSKPTTGAGTLAIATSNTDDGWAIQGVEFRALAEPTGGLPRIKIADTFVTKPIKHRASGTFTTKPLKIKVGGSFINAV